MNLDGSGTAAHPLLTSGSLHLISFLLRLLDEHRPKDPLVFLHNVLRRGGGGMHVSPPVLLEVLQQATRVPPSSLLETVRYSLMPTIGDVRDELWRQITFQAANALQSVAAQLVGGGSGGGKGNSVPSSTSPGAAVFRHGGAPFNPLVDNSCLPSFAALYQRGAPWQLLLAHRIVTSRMLTSLCGGVQPSGCCLCPIGKSIKIHVVVELDGEDPLSYRMCQRRVDDADGCDLLDLIVQETGLLLPPSSAAPQPSVTVTLEVVLVAPTSCLTNPLSRTQSLFRMLQEQIASYASPFSSATTGPTTEREDDADDALCSRNVKDVRKTRPNMLTSIRLHLADSTKWLFAPLHVLFSSPVDGAAAAPIDVRASGAVVLWIRDPKRHTELLVQLGHLVFPFQETCEAAASASGDSGTGMTPLVGVWDSSGSLLLDLSRGTAEEKQKSSVSGVTVSRSYLKYPSPQLRETAYMHLLRHVLRLSFGDGAGGTGSRLLPASAPCLLLRLGSACAVRTWPIVAAMQRVRELPITTTPTTLLSRLLAALCAAHASGGPSAPIPGVLGVSASTPQPYLRVPCAVAIGGGILSFAPVPLVSSDELLAALREAVAVGEAGGLLITDSALQTPGHILTTSSTGSVPDGAGALSAGCWRDTLGRMSIAQFDAIVQRDPMFAQLAKLRCEDRNRMEALMRAHMPSSTTPGSGVLSRLVVVPSDGVDAEENPTVVVHVYSQDLSSQYLAEAMDGVPKSPRTIAAQHLAAKESALAASLSSTVAVPSTTVASKRRT